MNLLRVFFLALVLLPISVQAAPPADDDNVWLFDVYLGDKAIGSHRFTATRLEQGWMVQNFAEFEVKFLFIKAFDYEHSSSEVWRGGCLASIDARTDANGKKSEVLGRQQADSFVLESGGDQKKVADCVASFAYWDRNLLQREQLLNAQTGEYLEVASKPLPAATMELGDRSLKVERIHLSAKDLDIVVSYGAESGQWVGLKSTLKNGRTLIYRRSADNLKQSTQQRVADARGGSLIGSKQDES